MNIEALFQIKGAVASVALSHPEDCKCRVCRAAAGDNDAFAEIFDEVMNDDRI